VAGLLTELGVDPDFFEWSDLALCKNIQDPDLFFERYEEDPGIARAVDAMCAACPVQQECGVTGKTTKGQGCWGGVYWDGHGKPDANRNSHKEPGVLAELVDRFS
jgi:hypothetical protein